MNEYSIIIVQLKLENLLLNTKEVKMRPIKYNTDTLVDVNQARLLAASVVLLAGAYLITGYTAILFVLAYDYFVRLYMTPLLSPVYLLVKLFLPLFSHKYYPVDTSARAFASHVGLTILIIVTSADVLDYKLFAGGLITVLAFWKVFEAYKNICIACRFYELLQDKNIEIISI